MGDVGGLTETVFLGVGGTVEVEAATASASAAATAEKTSVSGGFSKRSRYWEFQCEVMAWKWKGFELEVGDYDLSLDLGLIEALLDVYAQRRKVIVEKVRKKIRTTKRSVEIEQSAQARIQKGSVGFEGLGGRVNFGVESGVGAAGVGGHINCLPAPV